MPYHFQPVQSLSSAWVQLGIVENRFIKFHCHIFLLQTELLLLHANVDVALHGFSFGFPGRICRLCEALWANFSACRMKALKQWKIYTDLISVASRIYALRSLERALF